MGSRGMRVDREADCWSCGNQQQGRIVDWIPDSQAATFGRARNRCHGQSLGLMGHNGAVRECNGKAAATYSRAGRPSTAESSHPCTRDAAGTRSGAGLRTLLLSDRFHRQKVTGLLGCSGPAGLLPVSSTVNLFPAGSDRQSLHQRFIWKTTPLKEPSRLVIPPSFV